MTKREKQKAYRSRQAMGLVVLKIPVQHFELAQALIESGRLAPAQTLDRLTVQHEAAVILNEWHRRWN